jgi:uncharacterized protein YjiS (DUF1127 family)
MLEKPIAALRHLAEPVARWRARNRLRRELGRHGPHELDRILADAGLNRSDLPTILGSRARNRSLMARMLVHFGVRPDRIAVRYQGALRDAERVCAHCGSTGRCRRWLNQGATDDAPRLFCPNAELFDEMKRSWRD